MKIIFISLTFVFIFSLSLHAQNTDCLFSKIEGFGKIFPMKPKYEKSFKSFFDEFKQAINKKDAEFIYDIIDDEFTTYDYDKPPLEGKNLFKYYFDLENSECKFWNIAKRLIYFGGNKNNVDSTYEFPHKRIWELFDLVYVNYGNIGSNGDLAVCIGKNIPVYCSNNYDSPIIGYLNNDIIFKTEDTEDDIFFRVKLNNNIFGYVKKEDLYTYIGDGFIDFKKINGNWKIIASGYTTM